RGSVHGIPHPRVRGHLDLVPRRPAHHCDRAAVRLAALSHGISSAELGFPYADQCRGSARDGARFGIVIGRVTFVQETTVMLRVHATVMALLLGAAAALADEVGDCGHLIPERSIQGCSLLLESTRAIPQELALAYLSRGAAHIVMGDFDHAITDLDEAIRLYPRDPEAFTTRADAYLRKAGVTDYLRELDSTFRRDEPYTKAEQDQTRRGYYEQAIADYTRALVHNPNHLAAYFGRSLAHHALGSY